MNLAFAPEPWLRWQREHLGDRLPRTVTESLGLYRERVHPEGTPMGTDGWWEVSDSESARLAVAEMDGQLQRTGWPALDGMFCPGAMMARLRNGDLGWMNRSHFGVFFARAEALLLMVEGPSDALESQLAYALDNVLASQREQAKHFDAWVRTEAAKA